MLARRGYEGKFMLKILEKIRAGPEQNLDPDPKQSKKSYPDLNPDPKKIIYDPQHMTLEYGLLVHSNLLECR
jgi:hypothetical protein